MKGKLLSIAMSLILLVVLSGAVVSAQDMTEVRLGFSTWVGYGPLFIAQENGYFEDMGLSVEIIKVEDPKDRFVALAGGELDGLVTTLDTASQYWREDAAFVIIAGLDESAGGDGIVVKGEDIEEIADLEGTDIGVNVGSVSQFFLAYVLDQEDLSMDDVNVVNMKQGDVPAALAADQINAGVTWEPHLSAATGEDFGGHILIDSSETPGLIVDIMLLRSEFMEENPDVAQGLVDAWHMAVDFANESPDEAADIMAAGLGGWYETGDDVKADWAGVQLFDAEHNMEFFDEESEVNAFTTLQFAIDFYTRIEIITNELDVEQIIDPSYVIPETDS